MHEQVYSNTMSGRNKFRKLKIIQRFVSMGFHRKSRLRFTYGKDPEIFSISIMEKVPEIRNSGTIFFPLTGNFQNIVSESFRKNSSGITLKVPELH